MSHNVPFAPWDDEAAEPLVQFDGVSKKYGDFLAIDKIDLKIYPTEFFALLGPSGCGKTTLMRMLAGFEEASAGKITIDNKDMAGIPPNKRAVNMMFQSYALFPHLNVFDNLAFGLKRSRMSKSEIDDRVEEMLRLVQLQKFAKRKPHQLSGGQRQRVALARALAKAPKLLLLDEPLGALDKKLREETQFELMDIQEKTGTTFVIVTHDQEEAMTVASRIAVMDHGKLVQIDTPDHVYENPNSIYVADFIGDVNIIEGLVSHLSGEEAHLCWAEGASDIRGLAGQKIQKGEEAAFAIRPEKVALSAQEPVDHNNRVAGKIEDIAYLGNMSTYYVRLENGNLIKSQVANDRRISSRSVTWNDQVWLSWGDTAGIVLQSNGTRS